MSAQLHDHPDETEAPRPAFDSPEGVAHAKHHAKQNIFFFIGFFSLILCAVATYEYLGVTNMWAISFWAVTRVALIAGFFAWLIGHFSLVIRTFIFTIIFFIGMVFLSMFDSTLPGVGNPITRPSRPPMRHPLSSLRFPLFPPSINPRPDPMSLKTLHQIIIFAGFVISLISAWWCFTSPDAVGSTGYFLTGIGSVLAAIGLVAYEFYFLKKTRRLVIH